MRYKLHVLVLLLGLGLGVGLSYAGATVFTKTTQAETVSFPKPVLVEEFQHWCINGFASYASPAAGTEDPSWRCRAMNFELRLDGTLHFSGYKAGKDQQDICVPLLIPEHVEGWIQGRDGPLMEFGGQSVIPNYCEGVFGWVS